MFRKHLKTAEVNDSCECSREKTLSLLTFSKIKGAIYCQSTPYDAKGDGYRSLISLQYVWLHSTSPGDETHDFEPTQCLITPVTSVLKGELSHPYASLLSSWSYRGKLITLHSLCARAKEETGHGHGLRPFPGLQGSYHTTLKAGRHMSHSRDIKVGSKKGSREESSLWKIHIYWQIYAPSQHVFDHSHSRTER